jgi:5-(carboxyamino)imidazole ribonucleotide synthase
VFGSASRGCSFSRAIASRAAFTCAAWEDTDALARFAGDCAVITYEFENVPVAPLAALGNTPILPHPRALETGQDRLTEKTFVTALGGRTAPFAW